MKKRIGSRIYDTQKSERIEKTAFGDIYKKRTGEYFLAYDDYIMPLEVAEAKAMLGEDVRYKKEPEIDRTTLWVDRETRDRIANAAKKENLSVTDFLHNLAEKML